MGTIRLRRRSQLTRRKSFITALGLVWLAPASGAVAQAVDEVHCVSVHELTVSPGLSIRGSSGTADATSGTMDCDGPVDGRTPTGTGTYSDENYYGTEDPDTCQDGGEGHGVFWATVPTADGDQHLNAAFIFTYGDLTTNPGFVSGEFSGDGVSGTFKLTPLEGDCVTRPVTRVRVDAEFFFADSFFDR